MTFDQRIRYAQEWAESIMKARGTVRSTYRDGEISATATPDGVTITVNGQPYLPPAGEEAFPTEPALFSIPTACSECNGDSVTAFLYEGAITGLRCSTCMAMLNVPGQPDTEVWHEVEHSVEGAEDWFKIGNTWDTLKAGGNELARWREFEAMQRQKLDLMRHRNKYEYRLVKVATIREVVKP